MPSRDSLRVFDNINLRANFMKSFVSTIAVLAGLGLAANAYALDANFALGVAGMASQSGGSVSGGGASAGASALAGVTGLQHTQEAGTTGLAGTKLTLDNTGASIVSEHQVTGYSRQTLVGGSLGFAGSGGIGASTFNGSSFSQGQFLGVAGHLSF
jgi:hypothetical protein